MSRISGNNPTIFSDGNILSVSIGSTVYTIKRSLVTGVSLSYNVMGSDAVTIDIALVAYDLMESDEFDFYADKTVSELLQIIEKKIGQR